MTPSLSPDVESVDPTLASLSIENIIIDQYFQVAVVTILVYDTLITIDKEVKHFWRVPEKATDVVFFTNRYIGIFGAILLLFGKFPRWTSEVANILTIRVLALYTRDRVVSIYLYTLLVLEGTLRLGLSIYVTTSEHIVIAHPATDVTICSVNVNPSWWWSLAKWIVPVLYGVTLMVLSLYKAAEYRKISAVSNGFALVKVVIRDQSLYFMLLVSCSVFNTLASKVRSSDVSLARILDFLGNPSFLCVLGSRILLNLREAIYATDHEVECEEAEDISYGASSTTASEMEFA